MWPFRKKPDPKPWRWVVEERLEQQVAAAIQREHWKRAGPLLAAAQRRAMENAMGRAATQAEANRLAAFQSQALACERCHQFHPPVLGDCLDMYRGALAGAVVGLNTGLH